MAATDLKQEARGRAGAGAGGGHCPREGPFPDLQANLSSRPALRAPICEVRFVSRGRELEGLICGTVYDRFPPEATEHGRP